MRLTRLLIVTGAVLLGGAVASSAQIIGGTSYNIAVTCNPTNGTLPSFQSSDVVVDFPSGIASFTTNQNYGIIAFLQSQQLTFTCTSSPSDGISIQGATITGVNLFANSFNGTTTTQTVVQLRFTQLVVNGTTLPTTPSTTTPEERRTILVNQLAQLSHRN